MSTSLEVLVLASAGSRLARDARCAFGRLGREFRVHRVSDPGRAHARLRTDPGCLLVTQHDAPGRTRYRDVLLLRGGTVGGTSARLVRLPAHTATPTRLLVAARQLAAPVADTLERHCRDIVENALQGVLVTVAAQPVFANRAAADLLGYDSPETLLTEMVNYCQVVAPEDLARIRSYWKARVSGAGAPERYDFEARRADGSTISLQNHVRTMRWYGRDAVLNTLTDISERKQAERAMRAARDRAQRYLDVAAVMLLVLDTSGRVIRINRRGCETLGLPEEDILGHDWFRDFVPADLAPRLRLAFDMSVERRAPPAEYDESVVVCGNGTRKTIAWRNTLLHDEEGRITGTLSSGEDITARRRTEAELAVHRERLQQLYDDNPSIFFSLAPDGRLISANRFGAAHLGYAVEELLGRHYMQVFVDDTEGEFRGRLHACLAGGDAVQRWECRMRARSGDLMWVRITARLGHDPGNQPLVLAVCEDITEAHRLSEQLSYQATHDALTGLVNRVEFEKRLARVIDSARRDDSEHALCYLDLDQFKVINDTCGHSAGDELLRQLADVLRRHVRKRDTLARLGGDEFGALMEHCSLTQAERVANALRQAVADYRFVWEGKSFGVGVSVGVVPINEASERLSGMLAAADAACYAAKERGRNRTHLYNPNDADVAQRYGEMQWVARLNDALEQDRFQLWFQTIRRTQPDSRVQDGRHYELLLRLSESNGRVTPPGAFLPAAERYGLSPRVDRWVLESALGWLDRHPRHVDRLGTCSINLSGSTLADDGFLAFLTGLLDAGRVPCNLLCFEITETAAIANLSAAMRFIDVLKERGCRFALDDFGSGVSSFAYLKRLPVDFLKIDGVFVKDILVDPVGLAVVRSINELGHLMGKQTIAEFVEDQEVLGRLREIGVDYAQGYGIGPPRPIDELE